MSSNKIDVSNIVRDIRFDKPSDRLRQFILPKISKIFLGKNKVIIGNLQLWIIFHLVSIKKKHLEF